MRPGHPTVRSRRPVFGDKSGIALIEFAFVFPVLLLLFLAGYQIMDGLSCKRKVSIADRTVADLTAQSTQLSGSDVDNILAASTQVMAPYPVNQASVRVSQVYTDKTGKSTVSWSRSLPTGTAIAKGTSFSLPAALVSNDTYWILSETTYAYNPRVSFQMVGPMALTDNLFMSPRNSNSVTCSDC